MRVDGYPLHDNNTRMQWIRNVVTLDMHGDVLSKIVIQGMAS